MKYKFGDKIVLVSDTSDLNTIKEYTVKKIVDKEYIDTVEGSIYHSAFCFPIEYKDRLIEIVKTRQQLKKIYDDSISAIYQLKNEISLANPD